MDDLSEKNFDFAVDVVCKIIEENLEGPLSNKTQTYIDCLENYQNKIKVEDFFNFFNYLKEVELPKINPLVAPALHNHLSYEEMWEDTIQNRDIRKLEECDNLLINLMGGYVNSSLMHFFTKIFKKTEVSNAVQLVIEKEVENYFFENKEEIFGEYEKFLKKEEEVTNAIYS